jgi:hypothetical protein
MLHLFDPTLPTRLWIAGGLTLLLATALIFWLSIAVHRYGRRRRTLYGYKR